MRRRVAALVLALGVIACSPSEKATTPRSTLVIGLDISGSFRRNPSFNGAIEFAALYIYGHLNGVGGLQPNTAIFVGELGGERPGQAKVFHPIQISRAKRPRRLRRTCARGSPRRPDHRLQRVLPARRLAREAQQPGPIAAQRRALLGRRADFPGAGRISLDDRYKRVDMSALEFLSRNVTVRLLYADPPIAQLWERRVRASACACGLRTRRS